MDCGADGSCTSMVATCYTSLSLNTESCRAGERGSRNGGSGAGSGWRPSTESSAASATADQTP